MTLPRELQAQLRTEAGTFRAGERRRRFDATLSVGTPAGERANMTVPTRQLEYLDRNVVGDWFAALLEVAPADAASAWVSRAGTTSVSDSDRAWMVAAHDAFIAAGRAAPGCYVITRHGWAEVHTGESRVWKRLRLDR